MATETQNKRDWTAEERLRFERILCALISRGKLEFAKDLIDMASYIMLELDHHYKNTSHEPTNTTN